MVGLRHIRREEGEVGFPQHLVRVVCPERNGMGNVIEYHPAVDIFDEDEIRNVIDHGAQQVPLGLQRLFHPFAFGDVML